jgi:hypothetical protein
VSVMDLLVRGDDGWRPADRAPFASGEQEFQELIQAIFGELLGAQVDVPAVVAREVVTPDGGRIDVLAIDTVGVISICECKLERNAGARRAVLGQVLEYGGALLDMPVDDFLERVSGALRRRDPNRGDVMEEMARLTDDWSPETWRERVAAALERGDFRLILAVDALTPALRRTVEYLNDRAAFSLVVVEVRRLSVNGVEVLSPSFYGDELAQRKLTRIAPQPPRVIDADTLIVPSKTAIDEFERYSSYICQPERPIKPGTRFLGFYGNRLIDRRFPAIVGSRERVTFSSATVQQLRVGDDVDRQVAGVIRACLSDGARAEGQENKVVLLDLEQGFQLAAPITHPAELSRGAWTQNFRYTRRDALETQPLTTAELKEAGG